jgi:cytochrome c peroxidase
VGDVMRRIPLAAGASLVGLWTIAFLFLNAGYARSETAAAGEWTAAEWSKARRLSPLPPPPPSPTNALADSLQAARLGHRLFFDPRLSPHRISCATCHQPERGFADALPVAATLAPVHRHTMTILNVGHYRWLTWDGARDSLWHQAVGPFESPKEMGTSRLYVVRSAMRYYGRELAQIAPLPSGWDRLWLSLPETGKPGEAPFDQLPGAHQDAVNQVFVLVLKCLEAYERRIVSTTSPFDRYVAGEETALSAAARRGFQHFVRLQCDLCHTTPLFSDDEFHNLGVPSGAEPDLGRAVGLPHLQQSRFRGSGPYADGPPVVRSEDYRVGKALAGAFRTPSLREVGETAPYGHNGKIATLDAWLEHYVQVTTASQPTAVGRLDPTLAPVEVTAEEKRELIAFLQALSSDYASEWTQTPPDLSDSRSSK